MRNRIAKGTVAVLTALSLFAALIAATEPAAAAFRMGGGGFGGWHGGGFGGWHGGGFGGGRGGGWGGGWRTGWGGNGWRGGWGGNGWRGGWGCRWGGCGYGGWWWPGAVAGGVALAATYPYWGGYGYGYGYGYPNDNGCYQLQPVYSRHGRYLGRRWVNVCY
jgi:hypothetical protein